jgi:hypothetical protein
MVLMYECCSELLHFYLAAEKRHNQIVSQATHKFLFSDQGFKLHVLSNALETGIDSFKQITSTFFTANSFPEKYRSGRIRSIAVMKKRHMSGSSKAQITGLYKSQLETYR